MLQGSADKEKRRVVILRVIFRAGASDLTPLHRRLLFPSSYSTMGGPPRSCLMQSARLGALMSIASLEEHGVHSVYRC